MISVDRDISSGNTTPKISAVSPESFEMIQAVISGTMRSVAARKIPRNKRPIKQNLSFKFPTLHNIFMAERIPPPLFSFKPQPPFFYI